jgi:hypothetical protein
MTVYLDRADFLTGYWSYEPGQHVTLITPTQNGKTTLACQLLDKVATPDLPATMAVMKPRDPVPAYWTEKLGFKEVASWPPHRWPWRKKPRGWTHWPRHGLADVERDNAHLKSEIGKSLNSWYRKGNGIYFADEVYGMCAELELQKELIAGWTRAGGMKGGLWCGAQKPSGVQGQGGVPTFAYNSVSHLFLGFDPDLVNRKRFAEIGGVDPKLVSDIVYSLKQYEFLYIRKADSTGGPYLSVIGP